jgi:hypothetical protein
MKPLLLAIFMLLSFQFCAQEKAYKDLPFVRVFDLEGKKIQKGRVWKVTDTSLVLISKKERKEIPAKQIGTIKTKRSTGSYVLIGAMVGGAAMAIAGVTTAEPDSWWGYTEAEGAAGGAILGAAGGSILGWIVSLFKNSTTYQIDGSTQKLQQFKLEQY